VKLPEVFDADGLLKHRERLGERLADGRLRILERAIVLLEAIPEPRVAQHLTQHRELTVDRLRRSAFVDEDQQALFAAAQSRPEWIFAYVASALAFYCGLRACEIKGLQWKHVDWSHARVEVRRSKTPAGWRDPSLNEACVRALRELWLRANALGFSKAEHFLFPWHGRDKKIDPMRPMTSWRSAWRSLRKAAGLRTVRFHDGRHTALTRLAEKGQADWVIRAQMGDVSPMMMKTYSHIRRKAWTKRRSRSSRPSR